MINLSQMAQGRIRPTDGNAVRPLYVTHVMYPLTGYKDDHVTVRSLERQPFFAAANPEHVAAGRTRHRTGGERSDFAPAAPIRVAEVELTTSATDRQAPS